MNLDKLNISEEVKAIISEMSLDNDREILIFLEQYKYKTPDEIVNIMEDLYAINAVVPSQVNLSAEFSIIQEKYNVILNQVNDEELVVYHDYFGDDKYILIDMEPGISKYSIAFVNISPMRFDILRKKSLPMLNPYQVFKRYLIEAIKLKATDIHFDVCHKNGVVTYPVSFRIGGDLEPITDLIPINRNLNKGIISGLISKKTSANELDLMEVSGVVASSSQLLKEDVELRISASSALDGYHYVMRLQRNETFNMPIEKLGFDINTQSMLHRVTKKRSGITFITGAIRTGKNTTAFAVAHAMLKDPVKIISYESPIEVLMPFTQIDYKESEERLLNSVRLAKKQDVNIAFINELPNKEVASAVKDLVNSSVHVITTMHMNRIWHLPYKLKEYYGEEYKDVLSQINVVINQKMFPKMCPHCRKKMLTKDVSDAGIRSILTKQKIDIINVATGCEECGFTGIQKHSNQPYVEYLEFSDGLISDLLACDTPTQMEQTIKKAVVKTSLENTMCRSVASGDLHYSNLNVLL